MKTLGYLFRGAGGTGFSGAKRRPAGYSAGRRGGQTGGGSCGRFNYHVVGCSEGRLFTYNRGQSGGREGKGGEQ